MNEIEKKFLIKSLPKNLEDYSKIHIVQGYLCHRPALRVRKYGDDYILSYKFRMKTQKEVANIANEMEMPLTEEAYEHLMTKVDGKIIEKNRYLIPIQNNLMAELDVFEGNLKGLRFAEVEFPSEEEAEKFCPPDWFGEDVTKDRRFSNGYLSGISDIKKVFPDLF